MIDSTPPVSQRDCGPRCASVLLGFEIYSLGALSAWVASELARPEFMNFLGVAGIGAGLVISTTPRYSSCHLDRHLPHHPLHFHVG